MSQKGIKVDVKTGKITETEHEMTAEEKAHAKLWQEERNQEQLLEKYREEKAEQERKEEQADFAEWKKTNNFD